MKKIMLNLLALFSFASIFSPIVSFALDVGDIAPAFTIQSTHGEISLSDYAGEKHIVLALYFAVFSPV